MTAALLPLCAAVTGLCSAAAQAGSYGQVLEYSKISQAEGGFIGPLEDWDHFGTSIDCPGDLDGDGVADLIVGAPGRWEGIIGHGAVWILLLNPYELHETEGTVKAQYKIAEGVGGFPEAVLDDGDWFGWSVRYLGDLDGEGPHVHALAVGAYGDDSDGAYDGGAVWILFLDAAFTVDWYVKLSNDHLETGCPTLGYADWFGYSLDTIGDFDNDGVIDLAVGAAGNNDGGGCAADGRSGSAIRQRSRRYRGSK